jgi:transcriptional regulator with XRE-family HTH domain
MYFSKKIHDMKNKAHKTIRELRRVIGQTQAEFAAMIGASKDTVASWEIGRNKLSRTFARRIACATGVDGRWLLSGKGALVTGNGLEQPKPFTAEEFQRYRATEWGRSDEEGARRHLANCSDALELIFLAAAKAGGEQHRHRLPGVLDSFMQWCEGGRISSLGRQSTKRWRGASSRWG